jgi:hypothetical protein
MSAHRPSPDEPWPGWATSRAAQAAYGKHLVRIGQLTPALLYTHVMDRQSIAAAHTAARQDVVDAQVRSLMGIREIGQGSSSHHSLWCSTKWGVSRSVARVVGLGFPLVECAGRVETLASCR